MITSIPQLALNLGINFKGYEELANNVRRMSLISKNARQEILNRANKELPDKLKEDILSLIYILADDREVYEIAGLNYAEGPPKDEGLFTTALVDYLLRHKTF